MSRDSRRVKWPRKKGVYKAVQLYVDKKPRLELGDLSRSHGTILTEFLKGEEIEFSVLKDFIGSDEIEKNSFFKGKSDLPLSSGDRYVVAGMCYAVIDPIVKTAVFDSESINRIYGMGIDPGHLGDIRALERDWKIVIG